MEQTFQEMKKELRELNNKIKEESQWVGIKPYSHNIIGLLLSKIDKKYGKEEANKAIKNCKLEKLGWQIIK